MFTKPLVMVGIDGSWISQKDLKEVSLYNSVDMTLPELTFKVEDGGGAHTALMRIYVGAIIAVQTIEANTKLTQGSRSSAKYMNFIVTKVVNGFEHNDETMSGFLQVWCKPAWYMFGAYQGHAYAPMKLSELIKKVCTDANSFTKMKIEDDRFATSSDPGDTPRFKAGESDMDFIERKLLPYTNIDDSNVFFYVSWFNKPNLTSFARLISQTEKLLITPPQGLSGTVQDDITPIVTKKGIGEEIYAWNSIKLTIGNEDLRSAFATLKKQVTFENNETGKVYIANQQPKAKLGRDSGLIYNAKMPINAITMENIEATSNEDYPNRLLPDALALARNDDINIIDFMQIQVTVSGIIDKVVAGDTAYLLIPLRKNEDGAASESEKKKVVHWISGKWLIKAIQISQQDCKPEKSVSVIDLVRPTIPFNKSTTTISKPSYFYTVA